ncbi:MAG: transaldolase [Pirellulaceae bacterium]|nr:transaldolase [Pirellulaceae bacterium]
MNTSIQSLIDCGTKLYLDSVDPDLVKQNIEWGAVGATSNPVIISGLLASGRYDDQLRTLAQSESDDAAIAWQLTDQVVSDAQQAFYPVWQKSGGNAGWVSFELDPLIEDPDRNLPHAERVKLYVSLGQQWSAGHANRMIKVPATPAGIEALEHLAAAGVTLNVTLIFTMDQYVAARDSVWRGASRLSSLSKFKSVYSIFVSRVDQFTKSQLPTLSAAAQGQLGIVNAKRIWQANQAFWKAKQTPLEQEIIFASTGTKDPSDPAWKYVAALAGSDIQTNPPETNDAVAKSGQAFTRQVDQMPSTAVLEELDRLVDDKALYTTLMREGIEKFATPQKKLLATIAQRRAAVHV